MGLAGYGRNFSNISKTEYDLSDPPEKRSKRASGSDGWLPAEWLGRTYQRLAPSLTLKEITIEAKHNSNP